MNRFLHGFRFFESREIPQYIEAKLRGDLNNALEMPNFGRPNSSLTPSSFDGEILLEPQFDTFKGNNTPLLTAILPMNQNLMS